MAVAAIETLSPIVILELVIKTSSSPILILLLTPSIVTEPEPTVRTPTILVSPWIKTLVPAAPGLPTTNACLRLVVPIPIPPAVTLIPSWNVLIPVESTWVTSSKWMVPKPVTLPVKNPSPWTYNA